MSTLNSVIRSGTFLGSAVAALALTACSHSGQSERYGNVYDFEGGAPCVENCMAQAPAYYEPAPVYAPQTENVIYADCSVINGMSCPAPLAQPTTVYHAPICPAGTLDAGDGTCIQDSYTTSYESTTTYDTAPANCPAGTTPAGDGTCLQSSTNYGTSYETSTTYQSGTCPSGTTMQGDGTCAMNSGYTQPVDYVPTDYRPVRK